MISLVLFVLALVSGFQADSINICEYSSADITCTNNRTIYIQRANWGRTDNTTCGGSSSSNVSCVLLSSLETVQDACENKTSCTLKPSNSFFGEDPCRNTKKYLNLTYACIETKTKEVCNPLLPFSLSLNCNSNEKLNILKVFYGRNNRNTCSILSIPFGNCESSDTPRREILRRCQGQNSCSFLFPIALLNGCNTNDPYLLVDYQCLPQ